MTYNVFGGTLKLAQSINLIGTCEDLVAAAITLTICFMPVFLLLLSRFHHEVLQPSSYYHGLQDCDYTTMVFTCQVSTLLWVGTQRPYQKTKKMKNWKNRNRGCKENIDGIPHYRWSIYPATYVGSHWAHIGQWQISDVFPRKNMQFGDHVFTTPYKGRKTPPKGRMNRYCG